MIVTKTPLRVPFAGGLTDLKRYAGTFLGATCSCCIDKYIYVTLKDNIESGIDLKYMDVHEKVPSLESLKHDLTREALILTGLSEQPMEIHIMTDLNGKSGLGSSGAVTVGLLSAMHAYKGESVSMDHLIKEAAKIEIDILESSCGFHDMSICAFGGCNLIEYDADGVVRRSEVESEDLLTRFWDRFLLFYTGIHRRTKPSLDILEDNMGEAFGILHEMKALAYAMEEALNTGDIERAGRILQDQQDHKIRLPGHFLDPFVEDVMHKAHEIGVAIQIPGGKVGGYIMVHCPSADHLSAAREVFGEYQEIAVGIDRTGTIVTRV
jgi:D-glycero-alpha-D-manno-heptose-7-phosphate kinase